MNPLERIQYEMCQRDIAEGAYTVRVANYAFNRSGRHPVCLDSNAFALLVQTSPFVSDMVEARAITVESLTHTLEAKEFAPSNYQRQFPPELPIMQCPVYVCASNAVFDGEEVGRSVEPPEGTPIGIGEPGGGGGRGVSGGGRTAPLVFTFYIITLKK